MRIMEQLSRRAAVHHAGEAPVGDEEAALAADPHAGGTGGGHAQTSGTHLAAAAKRGTSARGKPLVTRVLLCMNSSRRNQILWGISIGVLVLTALYFLYIFSLGRVPPMMAMMMVVVMLTMLMNVHVCRSASGGAGRDAVHA